MENQDDVDFDRWIDDMARLLALPVDTAWREAVRANLAVLVDNMRLVEDFRIPDRTDPASVFEA